jgi:hypothetical protein
VSLFHDNASLPYFKVVIAVMLQMAVHGLVTGMHPMAYDNVANQLFV